MITTESYVDQRSCRDEWITRTAEHLSDSTRTIRRERGLILLDAAKMLKTFQFRYASRNQIFKRSVAKSTRS